MAITKALFGKTDGKEVYSYTLSNKNGTTAEILTYGGIIRKLVYDGVDVVLGRDSIEEYQNNTGYFAALIGRNSNRIAGSSFEIGGVEYKLYANNGKNNLHGGKVGFDKKVWDAQEVDGNEPSLVLTTSAFDGEEGFPGNVTVKVTYTLTEDNSLVIHYEGETDADTVMNLTNHAYFNLNGHNSGTVDGHKLSLNCDFYTPNSDECMPTGEILSVKGTPFDFSTDATMGERFASDHEQIKLFGGFDHNFVLCGRGYRKFGEFKGDKTGIVMEMYTDLPGVQIYSGNKIEKDRVCKDGAVYDTHDGVCFETQVFPNNLSFSHFPTSILKKGQKYDTTTAYKFVK